MSKFLFGDGFAISGGDGWRVRRRAVGPSLHRAYLETMIDRVFGPSSLHLNDKLQARLSQNWQTAETALQGCRGFIATAPFFQVQLGAHC